MFDIKRWHNAAPKLLLIKFSMKKEVAAVKTRCPEDMKKIKDLSKLDDARAAAGAFLKKASEAQVALSKQKQKDKGATDLMSLWVKTIKIYIGKLDKWQQVLIAEVNQLRKDDAAASQKVFDEIKADMERVVDLYRMARKHAVVALKLREKGEDTKSANHLFKSMKPIQAQMLKAGKSAWSKFKSEGKSLTPAQQKTVKLWLKPGTGKLNLMIPPVKEALDSVNGGNSIDLKTLFPPPPKL